MDKSRPCFLKDIVVFLFLIVEDSELGLIFETLDFSCQFDYYLRPGTRFLFKPLAS